MPRLGAPSIETRSTPAPRGRVMTRSWGNRAGCRRRSIIGLTNTVTDKLEEPPKRREPGSTRFECAGDAASPSAVCNTLSLGCEIAKTLSTCSQGRGASNGRDPLRRCIPLDAPAVHHCSPAWIWSRGHGFPGLSREPFRQCPQAAAVNVAAHACNHRQVATPSS